ncbi:MULTISPECIES: zinc ribbon domain-containing protein [unclassified Nonomuraea]|uniref:zinc ribbon domain-containing protein n=1 Tax=unclassified Nonomuraea TaxID=2593643 RepID=UPI0033E87648
MTDDPYLVDEFGEPIPLRPEGCPNCGQQFATRQARTCWKCGAPLDDEDQADSGVAPPSRLDGG